MLSGVVASPLQDDQTIDPLTYGRIASYYYLKHQTLRMFKERLRAELPLQELLSILTVSSSQLVSQQRTSSSVRQNQIRPPGTPICLCALIH